MRARPSDNKNSTEFVDKLLRRGATRESLLSCDDAFEFDSDSRADSSDPQAEAAALLDFLDDRLTKELKQAEGRSVEFGDYALLSKIGEGGMGTVFVAKHRTLGDLVAIKALHLKGALYESSRMRFEREARVLGSLDHPNIVSIRDAGEADQTRYIAFDLVPGESLECLINAAAAEGRQLPLRAVLNWMEQICDALSHAHARGVLHRDVKPANIIITPTGRAMLLDFGLAKLLETEQAYQTQKFVGTPAYAAPEQADSPQTVGPRADVYGVGATLYDCLTFSPPTANTVEELRQAAQKKKPTPLALAQPDLPPDLSAVVEYALAEDPSDRYRSADSFGKDLRALKHLGPISARTIGRWGRVWRWWWRHKLRRIGLVATTACLLGLFALSLFLEWRDHAAQNRIARAKLASASQELDVLREESRAGPAQRDKLRLLRHKSWSVPLSEKERKRLAELQHNETQRRKRRQQLPSSIAQLCNLAEQQLVVESSWLWPNPGARTLLSKHRTRLSQQAICTEYATRDDSGLSKKLNDSLATLPMHSVQLIIPAGLQFAVFRCKYSEVHQRSIPSPIAEFSESGSTRDTDPSGDWAFEVTRRHPPFLVGDLVTSVDGLPIQAVAWVESANERGTIQVGSALVQCAEISPTSLWSAQVKHSTRKTALKFRHRDGTTTSQTHHIEEREKVTPSELIPGLTLNDRTPPAGARLTVARSGRLIELPCPQGLSVRKTATPLLAKPKLSTGSWRAELSPGEYLINVFDHDGLQQRWTLDLAADVDPPARTLTLPYPEPQPPFAGSWKHVQSLPDDPQPLDFWMSEFELTGREYLQYCLETGTPMPDIGFVPAESEVHRWPILGVPHSAAEQYVEWRNRALTTKGWRFDLPTAAEYTYAARGEFRRPYTYGYQHLFRHSSACYSIAEPLPAPIGDRPTDESPFGIFDLCGNAAEYLGKDASGQPRIATAAWGQGETWKLRADTIRWQSGANGETGFRLVLRRTDPKP